MTPAPEAEELPLVWAIVVNYRGWRDTVECIDSLLKVDHAPLRIIVLDNASGDGSLEHLEAWCSTKGGGLRFDRLSLARIASDDARVDEQTRLVLVDCERNLGFAGANNVALRFVQEKYPASAALLLNNDAVIAANAVGEMVRALGEGDTVAGATVLRYDTPDIVEMFGGATVNPATGMVRPLGSGLRRSDPRPPTGAIRLDYVSGCCLMIGAAAVGRVGLMDERYFLYSEDVDWGLRMRRAGLRLVYCPGAEVRHKGGATVVHRSTIHDYYVVRGALMLVRKHFPATLPIALMFWLFRGIAPKLLRREWRRVAAALRGYRDFILGTAGPAAQSSAQR